MTEGEVRRQLDRVRRGEVRAFGPIVERFQDFVYTTVIRWMDHPQDAEEVTQETFIKAFRRLDSFRESAKFSTWLYQIAYRTMLDHRVKRRPTADADIVLADTVTDEPEIPTQLDLDVAVRQLPDRMRQALVLFYFNGFTYPEIAEIMIESEGNVKTLLYRARQQVKRWFEADMPVSGEVG